MSTYITELDAAEPLDGTEPLIVSQLSPTVAITATTLSAAASDNSFNDSGSGFVSAGFAEGDRVNVAGFTGNTANNLYVGTIETLTAGKMIIAAPEGDAIVDDAAGESVTITKWESKRTTAQELADFVSAALGISVETETGAYTLVLADAGKYKLIDSSGGACDLTVPANADEAIPVGSRVYIEADHANTVTIVGDAGVTVESRGSVFDIAGEHGVAVLFKKGTNLWTLSGDLA